MERVDGRGNETRKNRDKKKWDNITLFQEREILNLKRFWKKATWPLPSPINDAINQKYRCTVEEGEGENV